MKRNVSLLLVLLLLCGMLPVNVFAAEETTQTETTESTVIHEHSYENGICSNCGSYGTIVPSSDIDLFVFAGQSNMMGASVLEPEATAFSDKAWEYKYMPKLRGAETGTFVPARNSAGEWYYNDLNTAYGEHLYDLTYHSSLSNYSDNTYFCPAMSNGIKGFSAQSEANMYPSASLPPYFATEYANYGHSSIYAHMAKGSVKIIHYFTPDMMNVYNALISEYNAENGKSYKLLTAAELSGAGDAFDEKYESMLEDYAAYTPGRSINNKCFVWLQGESDGSSYIEYKLKMQVLWEHLQTLGFTHFFVLRVGYWGNTGILNVIKAQEDFCAENDGCYIVTRAPSLIPHPGATTENWWISEPNVEYSDCRDSYIVPDSSNHHFNEKAMQIFAERSAENIHRILYQGLDPILEEENIRGLVKEEQNPEEEQPEDTTPYTSYVGTDDFNIGLSVSTSSGRWVEKISSTAASTDLIPVASGDNVWLQYVFYLSEAHAVGGFYDKDGNLVAPLYYKDFGFSLGGGGGTAAFLTPEATNRVSIADVESATGKEIAYVRFTAWQASAGGHANTEARIYHSYAESFTAPTCTEQGYTTYTCECGESYVADFVDATGHTYENGTCTACSAVQPGPVITVQPVNSEAKLGQRYCVTVEAEGEGLTYQWYGRNAGSRSWFKSSVRDNTYDDVMTTARAGREVYCVITDANGNSVTTEKAKLICLPSAELKIVTQPADGEALLGERYCVSVEAEGEGLKYQWYFRNKGAKHWTKSSVTDSTYDDVMTAARAGREVYCVITDLAGNKVTTGTAKLVRTYKQLAITAQPADSEAPFGEKFCVTVEAEGEGLKYQWFYRKAGTKTWLRSGVRDNTYDDVMTAARANREVYCVITDRFGSSVTTEVATIIPVPTVPLRLLGVSYEAAAMGGRYCATVQAEGEGLTYQWYGRNAGSRNWFKSSVRDNTYDDVMNKTRANREVYCVITDAFGNSVTTETVTLTVKE